MKKYIFCWLLLGVFGIGETSVEGMELSTTEEKGLKKYIFISPSAIPDYSFEGKERIGFIPESKIKKILDLEGIPYLEGIPSLKDLCLDFLVSQIELGKDTPPEGQKRVGLGKVEIVSEEEDSKPGGEKGASSLSFSQKAAYSREALKDSKPGEEKAASSLSFFQKVDHQIEALSKNCPLNEDLKILLKVRICRKKEGIWEEWGKLSEEERGKQGGISLLREIGKEDFLDFFHFFRLKDENKKPWERADISLLETDKCCENFDENIDKENIEEIFDEIDKENVEKVFDEIDPFYVIVQKIKIGKLTDYQSGVELVSFLKKAKNLESVCFLGENLFNLSPDNPILFNFTNSNAPTQTSNLFEGCVNAMNENLSLNLKELILDGIFMIRGDMSNTKYVWETIQEARCFRGLEILNLRWNNLKNTHIKKLIRKLKYTNKFLPCLRSLILEGNDIRVDMMKDLWEVFKKRPCFRVLDLTGNPVFHKPSTRSRSSRFWGEVMCFSIKGPVSPERLFLKKTRFETVNLFNEPFVSPKDLWIQGKDLPLYAVTDKKPLIKVRKDLKGEFENI